ncbi:hypothetical protein ACHAPT_002177 [Fusarium lateritium]
MKRTRTEDSSPGPAIVVPDRPAQRRRSHSSEPQPTASPDLAVPTLQNPAAAMTREQDLATLHALVERRLIETRQEYAKLATEGLEFWDQLQTQKACLEALTFVRAESRHEAAFHEHFRNTLADDLQQLRRTVEHYQSNDDLQETLDPETRELVARDHQRRLRGMQNELGNAEAHLQHARRRIEAQVEEAKKRIEEDEAKLRDMGVDVARAGAERKRWRCIERLAVMEVKDLEEIPADTSEDGLGLLEILGLQD